MEDGDEEEDEEMPKSSLLPVTTNLHVGPLRKKTDSPKNQSVPSLTDAADNNNPKMSSATSMPMCPIHGASREAIVPPARSEPRIVITPRAENIQEVWICYTIGCYLDEYTEKGKLSVLHSRINWYRKKLKLSKISK